MKRKVISFIIVFMMSSFGVNNVCASVTYINCSYEAIQKNSTIKKNGSNKKIVRIVKSYKELQGLKRLIKQTYVSPKKEIKELNKYNRSFFKKNTLVFVSSKNAYENYREEKIKIRLNDKKLNVLIDTYVNEGEKKYAGNKKYRSYFITVKKNKIKNVKKAKVIRRTLIHVFLELPQTVDDTTENVLEVQDNN